MMPAAVGRKWEDLTSDQYHENRRSTDNTDSKIKFEFSFHGVDILLLIIIHYTVYSYTILIDQQYSDLWIILNILMTVPLWQHTYLLLNIKFAISSQPVSFQ